MGSDDKSACSALAYDKELRTNCSLFWDFVHGTWRDVTRMLSRMNWNAFMLVGMCVMNLAHGPDDTDTRWHQMSNSMAHHFNNNSAGASVLFQEQLPSIVKQLRSNGVDVPDDNQAEWIWQYTKDHSMFTKKGYKANRNRFHSTIAEGRALLTRAATVL